MLHCDLVCAERKFSEEEGVMPLIPSSAIVVTVCVVVLTCAIVHHHHVWIWLKLYAHRRQSVPGDINARMLWLCVFLSC